MNTRHHAPPRAEFGPVTVILGDKNGKYPDANMLLVCGADALAALDAPLVANHIGPEFDGADLIILGHVHEDHMAGLHRAPGTPVHVHVDDLEAARSEYGLMSAYGMALDAWAESVVKFRQDFFYQPRPDAIGYEDSSVWDLGGVRIRAVHLPGHTAGHCALVVEPEGVAFIGDIDLSSFGPYYGDASSSLADFRRSLEAVKEIPAKVWVTGHHRGIYTDRDKFLADLALYARKLDERDERLLGLLQNGPQTLAQLMQQRLLYPAHVVEPWVNDVERRSIALHLAAFAAAGKAEENGEGLWRAL